MAMESSDHPPACCTALSDRPCARSLATKLWRPILWLVMGGTPARLQALEGVATLERQHRLIDGRRHTSNRGSPLVWGKSTVLACQSTSLSITLHTSEARGPPAKDRKR